MYTTAKSLALASHRVRTASPLRAVDTVCIGPGGTLFLTLLPVPLLLLVPCSSRSLPLLSRTTAAAVPAELQSVSVSGASNRRRRAIPGPGTLSTCAFVWQFSSVVG
jgi:hypothetical protein